MLKLNVRFFDTRRPDHAGGSTDGSRSVMRADGVAVSRLDHRGRRFGSDFLWHINNPDKSDWFLNSEKSAIALCVFKEYYPEQQVAFASDLQYALNYEGRDLSDDEAYRHLLEKYNLPAEAFYASLHSPAYKEKAYYEFALVKQLQVTGFPAVLLQVSESKFYLISRGYTDYETLKERVDNILQEI